MARKIISVRFKEGVSKSTWKTIALNQPVLNTGTQVIVNGIFYEEKGVLIQWTDRHSKRNAILVPWSNINDVEYEPESIEAYATPVSNDKPQPKKN